MTTNPHIESDLSRTLERRLLHHVAEGWRSLNHDKLAGHLNEPTFQLHEGRGRLGLWDPLTRTISISADHALEDTWAEVELTIQHEMAHQIVSEIFDTPDAAPHGELFHRACRMLDADGTPRAAQDVGAGAARVLERVRKLMNLSSSSSSHEARVAVAKAHELLLRHNLEPRDTEAGEGHVYRFVGRSVGRVPLERKVLSGLLSRHFFVRTIWVGTHYVATGKRAVLLEISGRTHNVELAEYVHDYLLRTLDALWVDHRREAGPMRRVRARRNDFRIGALMGFEEHLAQQTTGQRARGLVWVGDPALDEHYARRHPHTSTMSGGRYRLGETHDAGRAQGRSIRIRPGVGGDGRGEGPTGLLR